MQTEEPSRVGMDELPVAATAPCSHTPGACPAQPGRHCRDAEGVLCHPHRSAAPSDPLPICQLPGSAPGAPLGRERAHSPGRSLPGITLAVHQGGHAAGELGPVGVQSAAPDCGEPEEEPGLPLTRPVASACLLTHAALKRLLQLDAAHRVAAESGASSLLDVQEHDPVIALDVKVYLAQKVAMAESITEHEPGRALILQAVWVRQRGAECLQTEELAFFAGAHVLEDAHRK